MHAACVCDVWPSSHAHSLMDIACSRCRPRHPLPFDRHDWVVVRPDGTEVRYIIDYYHDDARAGENQVPKLHDMDSVKSISVDVRPALDSVDAAVDRAVRMPLQRFQGHSGYRPLPFFWQGSAQVRGGCGGVERGVGCGEEVEWNPGASLV